MNQEKIGKYIAESRMKKNLTQAELANKIGVTNKAISRWENGHGLPDLSLIKPLCDTLDITVNDFLNGENIPKEQEKETYEKNIIKIINQSKVKEKKVTNRLIIISFITILVIIGTIIFYTLTIIENEKNYKLTNNLIAMQYIYREKLNNINNNLNSTSTYIVDHYWQINEFETGDDIYNETLTNIIEDLRTCYDSYTKDNYGNIDLSNIYNYMSKSKIEEWELKYLNEKQNKTCLTLLEKYKHQKISSDESISAEFLSNINSLYEVEQSSLFSKKDLTFNELISKSAIELSMVENISNYVTKEYQKYSK